MLKVNYAMFENVLEWAIINKKIMMVKGAPGIGKSQIVDSVIKKLNNKGKSNIDATFKIDKDGKYIDIEERLYQRGAYANGLATIREDCTRWTIPEWLEEVVKYQKEDKNCVLILDDFHLTIPSVMNITYQLFEKYQINSHKIDPIPIIILGNFDLKSAEGFPVQSPIMGRLTGGYYELEPDIDSFIHFSTMSDRIHPKIVNFLALNSSYLYDKDPKSMVMTYSPRNWENLSNAIRNGHPRGIEAATAFVGDEAGGLIISRWDKLDIKEEDLYEPSGKLSLDQFKAKMFFFVIRKLWKKYEEVNDKKVRNEIIETIKNKIDKFMNSRYFEEVYMVFMNSVINDDEYFSNYVELKILQKYEKFKQVAQHKIELIEKINSNN